MPKLSDIINKKLQSDLRNFPFKYSIDEFNKDKKRIDEHLNNVKHINRHYAKQFDFQKQYFNFLIRKNSQLILSLKYYFDKSQKAKDDYSPESFTYKALNDFWKLFTVVTNNYIVLRDLLLNGGDYQAKIIFRNTLELSELLICILGDEKFYTFFKKKNTATDIHSTFSTMKFDTLRKTTHKIIEQIKLMPNINIPAELWGEYLKMRQDFYKDTSKHIHSNFLNLMLGSHVQMLIGPDSIEEDMMVLNLGGLINTSTKKNINDVLIYDSITYLVLLVLIVEKHKLFFAKIEKDLTHLTILSKLNWDLLTQIIK
jgi:hypothetical protein